MTRKSDTRETKKNGWEQISELILYTKQNPIIPIAILIVSFYALHIIIAGVNNYRDNQTTNSREINKQSLNSPQSQTEREKEIKEGAVWLKNAKQGNSDNQSNIRETQSYSGNNDTKIASVILTISCAGNKGLIARNQMGSMMKKMFADEGINSTEVYENWDYYWGLAKEMDTVNKTYCLK